MSGSRVKRQRDEFIIAYGRSPTKSELRKIRRERVKRLRVNSGGKFLGERPLMAKIRAARSK